MTSSRTLARAFLLTLSCLPACSSFYAPLDELTDHDQPLVVIPATVGAVTFGVIGVPIAVAALPISVPVGAANDANLAPLAPVFIVAQVGAMALGGVPWLLLD